MITSNDSFREKKGVRLYSANRQQAARYYKKPQLGKEYPLSLRRDLIDLHKAKTFWFLRV
jgi:hypothetical protein